MSLKIDQAILHAVIRSEDGQLQCKLRPQPLSHSNALDDLVGELHRLYTAKAGKGYGHFGAPLGDDGEPMGDTNDAFREALIAWRAGEKGFVEFSAEAGQLLGQELGKYDFATGGYLLMAAYNHVASDYLFVAMLSPKPSVSVSDEMEVQGSEHLDLSNLQLAARIDLTEWQADPTSKKYLTFVKGRAGRKVADFFLDFMGCVEGVNAKAQNQQLMKAVEDFVADTELDKGERQQARDAVFDYCKSQVAVGEPIQLKDVSDELADQGLDAFYQFTSNGAYDLEETFPADQSTLRALKKFSGTGGGVSVSFDAQHLGERVQWDPVRDTLTIHGVPPNLLDQLKRRLAGEKDD
ncbi:nucleoid-associated protein YejK [Ferrimonas balearica]|uniref:nucleoid-associated protein YejK n=1 Tax=Ferrimonas balearica TaxID=44012 RepID=UPI001C5989A4|nr:nucleoid-associated protein YejK [Ferrimonas balearica]MBW3138710.1 nucleoid-associated protein YejK [Ferrimonas balearica]MBY6105771.1 nucleoid-associated protein YejK [Ferrimonas balearica]MBY6223687.1 nucleoid-associated protein YejK [Ferrimonas balearica]